MEREGRERLERERAGDEKKEKVGGRDGREQGRNKREEREGRDRLQRGGGKGVQREQRRMRR